MPLKDVSISADLYSRIKEEANKRGLSIRAFVESIIKQALEGSGDEHVTWKEIVVKYDSKCIYCGKEIKRGDRAMWAKGIGVAHLSCFIDRQVDSLNDKVLAKKYLKIRELEKVKAELQREVNTLADVVLTARAIDKLNSVSHELVKLSNQLRELIVSYGSDESLAERVFTLTEEIRDLRRAIISILNRMKSDDMKKVFKVVEAHASKA